MALSLAGFFVLDQHRLQPWAWQFFLLAVLLSLADDTTARRGWRWLVIGIYFWSAVSKLDYTFCHEQGPALLGGLKQAMGLRGIPNRWTVMLDISGSACLALGEMSVAVMLAWPRSRWLGLWTATIMHLSLLAALGPFGLNHSLGVLLWNVFFIVQDWLLFRESTISHPPSDETVLVQTLAWLRELVTWPSSRPNRLALGVIAAAMVWPVLEPFGYCDHWLGWAVYSARTANVPVYLLSDDKKLPPDVARYVVRHPTISPRLDLAQWSVTQLAAPIYPQSRFQIGVILALDERCHLTATVLTTRTTRNRWTGYGPFNLLPERCHELRGAAADSFIWNAYPRMVTFGVVPKNPSP